MTTLAAAPPPTDVRRPAAPLGEPRRRCWGRWVLLAGIAVGVFLGAMSCAAGMAAGGGHDAHANAGAPRADHAAGAHVRHVAHGADGDAASSTRSDPDPGSTSLGQGHPGMACVMSVQLREADVVVPGDVRATRVLPTVAPPGCVTEPEPPVPRFS